MTGPSVAGDAAAGASVELEGCVETAEAAAVAVGAGEEREEDVEDVALIRKDDLSAQY